MEHDNQQPEKPNDATGVEQPQTSSADPIEQTERAETPDEDRPKIWVGSLSDYNNGVLHGEWMDAAREPDEVHADIQRMLSASPTAAKYGDVAEEWGIFDHEGFGAHTVHEYDSIDTVSRIARGIEEHGLAFAAWADMCGNDNDRLDQFEEAYLGHYPSAETWVEQLMDDLGHTRDVDDAVPESLRPYVRIDIEGLARDMQLGGDVYTAAADDGGIYLFDSHV
jgi:antirestriction protein